MKQLILAILSNPAVAAAIGLMVLIYGFLFLLAIRRNQQLSALFENGSIRFLVLCQSELMLTPFVHWSTLFLIIPPFNTVIAYSQFCIYGYIIFALWPTIKEFLKTQFSACLIRSIFHNPFFWLLSLLAIVSSVWSETPLVALKSGLVLLGINLVSLYVSARFSWDDIFSVIRWNIAIVALLSFIIRRSTNAGTTDGGGLAGVLPSKNTLGAIMALGVTLWILHSLKDKQHRLVSITMSLACTVILVQARSGGAYFIFMTVLAITLSSRFLRLFKFQYAAIVTSIFFFLVILASFLAVYNIEEILGLFGKDLTLTGRNKVWPIALQAASEKLWTGYGMFSFWQPWQGSDNPALDFWSSPYWVPPSAHQGFLDILLQLGVIGLTVMLFNLGITLIQSMRYFFKNYGIMAILPATVVLHHFIANLPETRFMRPNAFWIFYALVSVKLSLVSQEKAAERQGEGDRPIPYNRYSEEAVVVSADRGS